MKDELSSAISRRMGRLQNKHLPIDEETKIREDLGVLCRQRQLRYWQKRREEDLYGDDILYTAKEA